MDLSTIHSAPPVPKAFQPRFLVWWVPLTALLPQAAYPPVEWAPAAWFALVPVLAALRSAPVGAGAWLGIGWGWGLVFNAVQFRWLPEALLVKGGLAWPAFVLLTGGSIGVASLYPAAAFALARWLHQRLRVPMWGAFPCLFALQDALLGVSPFGGQPWASLALTQTGTLAAGWLVPVFGASGLVFLIAIVNAAWAEWTLRALDRPRIVPKVLAASGVGLAAVTALCGWPAPLPAPAARGIPVLIVPGGVPVSTIARSSRAGEVMRFYLGATLANRKDKDGTIVLAIWPESAAPGQVSRGRALADLFAISRAANADFLFGSNAEEQGRLYNSAFLVTAEQFESRRYDKMRLVPFGEYVPVPFRAAFGKKLTEGVQDYSSGRGPAVLTWRGVRLGMAICFESILPGHARRTARDGGEVLAAISNDQWLTPDASRQHLRLTALRALEIGRDAVVATNGGWSGHLRGGRIVAESPPGGPPLRVAAGLAGELTPWARWGYLPLALLGAIWLGIACLGAGAAWRRAARR